MAPSLLGSANLVAEVDRPLLLTRGVEPQCGVTPWLRKLDRSGALPESIFEHCVSPSPPGKRLQGNRWVGWVRIATAAMMPCNPRKSQAVTPSTRSLKKRTSELGGTIRSQILNRREARISDFFKCLWIRFKRFSENPACSKFSQYRCEYLIE
jgi:hypothetical protein